MRRFNSICIIVICLIQFSCSKEQHPINLGVAKSCDAAVSNCTINVEDYSLTLELGSNVKPLTPFHISLKVIKGSQQVKNVVVDFRMTNMDMGMNRYRLTRKNDVWTGDVTLPVCVASRTDWLAIVEFVDAGEIYVASFPFHAEAN